MGRKQLRPVGKGLWGVFVAVVKSLVWSALVVWFVITYAVLEKAGRFVEANLLERALGEPVVYQIWFCLFCVCLGLREFLSPSLGVLVEAVVGAYRSRGEPQATDVPRERSKAEVERREVGWLIRDKVFKSGEEALKRGDDRRALFDICVAMGIDQELSDCDGKPGKFSSGLVE